MPRPKDPNLELVWRQRLQRHSTSGLSISAFCAREGVSSTSFQTWKRRLAARSLPPLHDRPLFVPLHLDPEWLGRVVAALAGLPRQEATP